MIKRVPGIGFIRKIPIRKTAQKCFVGMEIVGVAGASSVVCNTLEIFEKVANPIKQASPKTKTTLQWEKAQKKAAELKKIAAIKRADSIIAKRQKSIVLSIMREDINCTAQKDKNRIAEYIVKIAKEYGADPIHIACIAKQETHFTENLNSTNGKGMMQITKIATKDMFSRPNFYHKKLKEITSRYRNYGELYSDIQKKPLLNMRIGVLLYEARLREANGNIRTALINYNGSSRKYTYASSIINDINKYQTRYKDINNAYIAKK